MVEEDRLDQRLEQIHEVIVPANVGQFVGQDQFQLPLRQTRHYTQRQQDRRTKIAYDHGRFDHHRLKHLNCSGKSQPLGRSFQHALDRVSNGRNAHRPQSTHRVPTEERPQGSQQYPGKPEQHDLGQPRLNTLLYQ